MWTNILRWQNPRDTLDLVVTSNRHLEMTWDIVNGERRWSRTESDFVSLGLVSVTLITEPWLTLFARSVNVFRPGQAAALRQWLSWKVPSDIHQSTSKRRLTAGCFLPGTLRHSPARCRGCHTQERAFHISSVSVLLWFWRRIKSSATLLPVLSLRWAINIYVFCKSIVRILSSWRLKAWCHNF